MEQAGEVIRELNRIMQKEFMAVMFFIDKEDKRFACVNHIWKERAGKI